MKFNTIRKNSNRFVVMSFSRSPQSEILKTYNLPKWFQLKSSTTRKCEIKAIMLVQYEHENFTWNEGEEESKPHFLSQLY